jgi:phage-related protein
MSRSRAANIPNVAQQGGKHSDAKPLKGFGGAGVVEIIRNHKGDAFRVVYTVRLADAVYVLHAFQKKSKTGRETPKADIDMIERRMREAERISEGERR